jgi:hypothetical protein
MHNMVRGAIGWYHSVSHATLQCRRELTMAFHITRGPESDDGMYGARLEE